MQKIIAVAAISYFVITGAELVAFSILNISAPLWQCLAIAAVLTAVSVFLGWHFKGEYEWTPSASANSSTTETALTAN